MKNTCKGEGENCPNLYVFTWNPGSNYPDRYLPYPPDPTKAIKAYKFTDGVIVYDIVPRNSIPTPVVVPQSIADRIKTLVQELIDKPTNIQKQVIAYLRKNPDIVNYIKAAAVGSALGIIVGTVVEDFVSGGAGVIDDWACFSVAYDLVEIAIAM